MNPSGGAHWLTEGMAKHVELVAAEKWGTTADPEPERRAYDYPLHGPPPSEDREHDWEYGSWYFWDFLGEHLA